MRRLNHHQYTTISMIEDVLAELELTEKVGLYVDTWKPGPEDSIRITLVEEEALFGSVDGQWYSQHMIGMQVEGDGRLIEEDGVLACDADGYITMAELTEWLSGYQNTED